MNGVHDRRYARKLPDHSFLAELSQRTQVAPIRSNNGNAYVLIDMHHCSTEFLQEIENFFEDSDSFRLLIRGVEYCAEVLNGVSFDEACRKLRDQ